MKVEDKARMHDGPRANRFRTREAKEESPTPPAIDNPPFGPMGSDSGASGASASLRGSRLSV